MYELMYLKLIYLHISLYLVFYFSSVWIISLLNIFSNMSRDTFFVTLLVRHSLSFLP